MKMVKETTAVWVFVIGFSLGILFGVYLSHLKPINNADNRSSLQAECEKYGGC